MIITAENWKEYQGKLVRLYNTDGLVYLVKLQEFSNGVFVSENWISYPFCVTSDHALPSPFRFQDHVLCREKVERLEREKAYLIELVIDATTYLQKSVTRTQALLKITTAMTKSLES